MSLFRCCVLFTHLAMVHGLQGNNIHFSAAATLCQQIVPHFASQFHGTNLESLAFALATTISCWANKSMARERSDWQTLLFFPELFFFSPNIATAMSHASLDCNTTPELCHDGDDGTVVGRWYSSDVMIDGGGFCFATRGDWETLLFSPNFFFCFFSSSRRMRPGLLALPLSVTRLANHCHVDGHVWYFQVYFRPRSSCCSYYKHVVTPI